MQGMLTGHRQSVNRSKIERGCATTHKRFRITMRIFVNIDGCSPRKVAAQPGIAADRFAREIIGILKASSSALAAAECQAVGPPYVWPRSQEIITI